MVEIGGDYWLDESCTVSFGRHFDYNSEEVGKRHDFLKKYATNGRATIYPFCHATESVDDEWWEKGWGLDPLIIPLVRKINTLTGVKTFSSCQGCFGRSPNVTFTANIDGAENVRKMFSDWHRKIHEGWHWNNVIISFNGQNKCCCDSGEAVWHLFFYDTLALIKFTVEYLEVPLEVQIPDQEIREIVSSILNSKSLD